MPEDLITELDNYFLTIAKVNFVPFENKSVTYTIKELVSQDINPDDIYLLSELLLTKSSCYISEALDEIGCNDPTERLEIARLLGKIDINKLEKELAANQNLLLTKINSYFNSNRLKFILPPSSLLTLMESVKKIKYSNNATMNIKLLANYQFAKEVIEYSPQYTKFSLQQLRQQLEIVSSIRASIIAKTLSQEELTKQMHTFLVSSGHIEMSLQDKDYTQLQKMILLHCFAIKANLRIRTNNRQSQITFDALIDYAAQEITIELSTMNQV